MDFFGLFDVSGWLIVFVILLVTIYWYFSTKEYLFEKAGIPGPRPKPFIGNILGFFTKGLHRFDVDLLKTYGKLVGLYSMRQPTLLLADPDLIKQVFVKDTHICTNRMTFDSGEDIFNKAVSALKGDQWKMIRSILTPTFSASKIRKMMPLISGCTKQLRGNLLAKADKEEKFEAKEMFGKFTMDVIAHTMFGLDVDCQKDSEVENDFVKYAKKAFNPNLKNPLLWIVLTFPKLMPLVRKLGLMSIIRDQNMIDFFVNTTKEVIKIRKEGKDKYNDFIQLMLNAHKDDDFIKHVENEGTDTKEKLQKGLTEIEILAQTLIFFLAGYETTASLLSWASYCLAVNPEVQEMLREEIMDKIGDKENITYDDVHEFPFLDNVVNETLRMHPPVLRFDRVTSEDYELAGYKIPAGVDIQVPVYFMHHNEEWWDEPMKFKPERFDGEERKNRNPYIFLPFGVGPRNCIAMRFALIEAKVALVAILCKYKLALASGMSANINPLSPDCKMKKAAFHYPADGIWLKCEVQHIVE